MARTLITGASQGRAYRLKNQLSVTDVLLGDYMDLPELMVKSGQMIKLPDPKSETYPHQMLALCLDYDIGTLYLLQAEEVNALNPSALLFNEYNIKLEAAHDKV